MKHSLPIFLAFAVTMSAACSDVKGGGTGGDGDGDGDGPAGTWIFGSWAGNFKNKDSDEGSSLRGGTTATATFTRDDDDRDETNRTGTFEFQFPLLEIPPVKGKVQDFAGKSVLLVIKESEFSALGLPGSSTDLSYDLVGDALELRNERITIKLLRQEKPDTDPDTDPAKDNPLVGRWDCLDRNGNSWYVTVKSESSFKADIFAPGSARAGIYLDGSVETDLKKNPEATLTVNDSDVPKYVGMKLTMDLLDAANARLVRYDGEKVIDTMNCVLEQ